jgi:hypothetical protein
MIIHKIALGLVLTLFGLLPLASWADGCGVSHEECKYICTEYYPNGTDCKKTRKECYTVCDDFDVDHGGVDDANRQLEQKNQD